MPRRALLHPAWLIALAVLVLNDHVFKRTCPGLVTGKLSDFAGLFVAPALVAAIARARSRRGLAWAHVLVALGFMSVKLSPVAADALARALTLVGFASKVWCDPTDLVALLVVPIAWRVLVPAMQHASGGARAVTERIVGALASLMCMATSNTEVVTPGDVHVTSSAYRTIKVGSLAQGVDLDCEAVRLLGPGHVLTPKIFDPPSVENGTTDGDLRFSTTNECDAHLLEIDGLPSRIVYLDPKSTATINVDRDWSSSPGPLYPIETATRPTDPACVAGDPRQPITWPPTEGGALTVVGPGAAGCFDARSPAGIATYCVPESAWPFAAGDALVAQSNDYFTNVTLTRTSGAPVTLLLSTGAPPALAHARLTMTPSCQAPDIDACGQVWLGMSVTATDDSGMSSSVAPEALTSIGSSKVLVARATQMAVVNPGCTGSTPVVAGPDLTVAVIDP